MLLAPVPFVEYAAPVISVTMWFFGYSAVDCAHVLPLLPGKIFLLSHLTMAQRRRCPIVSSIDEVSVECSSSVSKNIYGKLLRSLRSESVFPFHRKKSFGGLNEFRPGR